MPPNRQERQSVFFLLNSNNLHTFLHIFEEVGDFEPGTGNNFEALSETRWECRLDNVKAIRFLLDKICKANENGRDSCDEICTVTHYTV
jgi:hypothetical protein